MSVQVGTPKGTPPTLRRRVGGGLGIEVGGSSWGVVGPAGVLTLCLEGRASSYATGELPAALARRYYVTVAPGCTIVHFGGQLELHLKSTLLGAGAPWTFNCRPRRQGAHPCRYWTARHLGRELNHPHRALLTLQGQNRDLHTNTILGGRNEGLTPRQGGKAVPRDVLGRAVTLADS